MNDSPNPYNAFGGLDHDQEQVLRSAGGYYYGSLYYSWEMQGWYPYERTSVGYYLSRAEAELDLPSAALPAHVHRQLRAYEQLLGELRNSVHVPQLVKDWVMAADERIRRYAPASKPANPWLPTEDSYPQDRDDPHRPEDYCLSCGTGIGTLSEDDRPLCSACWKH